MEIRRPRVAAAGLLCAAAATIALWSGPLAALTHGLHSNGAPPACVSGRTAVSCATP